MESRKQKEYLVRDYIGFKCKGCKINAECIKSQLRGDNILCINEGHNEYFSKECANYDFAGTKETIRRKTDEIGNVPFRSVAGIKLHDIDGNEVFSANAGEINRASLGKILSLLYHDYNKSLGILTQEDTARSAYELMF